MKRLFVSWCELYPWPFIDTAEDHYQRVKEARDVIERCNEKFNEGKTSMQMAEEAAKQCHVHERYVMDEEAEKKVLEAFKTVFLIRSKFRELKENGESIDIEGIGTVTLERL